MYDRQPVLHVLTSLRGGEDELVHGVLVADLDRGHLQRLSPLPGVEERQLAVVAPAHQQVGVLGVVLQAEHGRGRLQRLLRLVGVLWRTRAGVEFGFCRSG